VTRNVTKTLEVLKRKNTPRGKIGLCLKEELSKKQTTEDLLKEERGNAEGKASWEGF